MKRLLEISFFSLLTCLVGCQSNNSGNNELPSLYDQPTDYDFNLEDPYLINPISGDSIDTVLKSNLGTIMETGNEIPLSFEVLDIKSSTVRVDEPIFLLDSGAIEKPEKEKKKRKNNKKKEKQNLSQPQHFITNHLPLEKVENAFFIQNQNGDTIPTGVEVRFEPEILKLEPKIFKVEQPALLENSKRSILALSEAQGLPSQDISDIVFDQYGNAWFGSGEVGLLKYDGNVVERYSIEEGMRNEIIQKLMIDDNGDIWGGTNQNSLFKFDGDVFTWWSVENGFPIRAVWDMTFDAEGNIWFTSTWAGLVKFDLEKFTFFTLNEGLPSTRLNFVACDAEGFIWASIYQNGLIRFNEKEIQTYTDTTWLPSNYISKLFVDSKDRIWIGTYTDGACYIDDNMVYYLKKKDGLLSNYVSDINEDKEGNIWLSCFKGGVVKFNDGIVDQITQEDGLIDHRPANIEFDENNNVWVGSAHSGLSFIRSNVFQYEPLINQGAFYLKSFSSVSYDKNGEPWYGSGRSGLYHKTKKGYEYYSKDQNLNTRVIRKILHDRDNHLWIADYNFNIIELFGDSAKTYFFSEHFGYPADKLFIDSKNNLWFSSYNFGIYKYDGTNFYAIKDTAGNTFPDFNSFAEDSKGNIWMTSYNTLSKISGSTLINYGPKEGVFFKNLANIKCDDRDNIWIGSYTQGVIHFDGRKFHYFNQSNGLYSNRVTSLVPIDSTVWVTTRSSLSQIVLQANGRYKVRSFDNKDGFQAATMHLNEYHIAGNEISWLGYEGIQNMNLNAINDSSNLPEVFVTDIHINGESRDFSQNRNEEGISYMTSDKFVNVPKDLVLSSNNNHITFHFNAIDWNAPHKLRYSYRIKELGENWSEPSSKTIADYRGLQYGNYTFELAVIGESQVWSDPIEYQFEILPPWYHTLWARALYLLFAGLLIYAFMKWRTSKLEARQKELEHEVELATEEIREQKRNVELQKDIIEEAHKEITDSIEYAKRIQSAILPHKKLVKQYLENSFILYKPKNIVAGDFYWMEHQGDTVLFAAADCTGHGVPGAMVSVICHNAMNRSVREYGLTDPGKILDKTRDIVIEEFDKSEEDVKDGMDIALCALNGMEVKFAGAHNPLWVIREGELIEIKGDKQPIGQFVDAKPFTTHTFQLQKEDILFIFSDGYADQFGGDKGKKMKASNFKKLLLSIQDKAFEDQEIFIDEAFEEWKGDMEQLDDVCVIGVKI